MDELRTAKSNTASVSETTQKKSKTTKSSSQRKKTTATKSTRANKVQADQNFDETDTLKATAVNISNDLRREMIAKAAYFRAAQRGFSGGSPEDDWLAAEVEIEALLKTHPTQKAPI